MKEFIMNNLAAGTAVSLGSICFKLGMALLIGLTIYVAYYLSSPRVTYNSSFNLSLVAMTVITTAIMAVISSNIALSLGMVGALSIIRFRTAIKDTRDTMFIFWSIMVGICCGVSQYIIAMATTAILFLFYLFIRAFRDERRYILIIRCASDSAQKVQDLVFRSFPTSRLSVKNTTAEYCEFIYELKNFHNDNHTAVFEHQLYDIGGVECANFVLEEEKASA